jgi:hypothetical protein
MDFYSDEEIDSLFSDQEQRYQVAQRQIDANEAAANGAALAPVQDYPAPPAELPPVPLFPLAMASAPNGAPAAPAQQNGIVGFVTKPVGPLPVWAWTLLAGAGGAAFYFATKKAPEKNSSEGSEDSKPSGVMANLMAAVAGTPSSSGGSSWRPSRSEFAASLERFFQRKGKGQHVKVWVDADDAQGQGKMKTVSPLVNVQVHGGAVKVDQALQRFARREGLNPVQHSDGSIGLYPHSSKRGKEWEGYIDALRDEGQRV